MRLSGGSIDFQFNVDGREFDKSLKTADNVSKAFADNVDKRFSRSKKSVRKLGEAAGLTEREIAQLEGRMKSGFAADSASRVLDNLTKHAGLTKKELAGLEKQLGLVRKENTSFASASLKVEDGLGRLTKRAAGAAAAYLTFQKASQLTGDSLTSFREYETALTDMSKVTDRSLSAIAADIAALPPTLGDATALLGGYYQTISAGVTDTGEAMETLTTASKAAKAAHVEQSETIKVLTKMMAGFHGQIEDVSDASDLLFRIERMGQTSVQELVPVMGELAQATDMVGASQYDLAGGLALITQTAGSTAEAGTQWRAIMMGLYKPTENMAKVLEALGYESGQAMVESQGLSGTLQTLQGVADSSGFSLGKLFESTEALGGIAALSADDWAKFNDMVHQAREGADETDKAFGRWETTFDAVKAKYDATLHELGVEFGAELAPTMTSEMDSFAKTVMDNKDAIITTFGGIATAVGLVTKALAGAAGLFEDFSNLAAGAMAVTTGKMNLTDYVTAAPDRVKLREALQAAGDKYRQDILDDRAHAKTLQEIAQARGLSDRIEHGEQIGTLAGNVVDGAFVPDLGLGDLSTQLTKLPKGSPVVDISESGGGGGGAGDMEKALAAARDFASAYKLLEADLTTSTTGEIAIRTQAYKDAFAGVTYARGDEINAQIQELSQAEGLALSLYGDTEDKRAAVHAAFAEKRKKVDQAYYDWQRTTAADFADYDFWHAEEQAAAATDVTTIREQASKDLDRILGRDLENQLAALDAEYQAMLETATDKGAVDTWYFQSRRELEAETFARQKELAGDFGTFYAKHVEGLTAKAAEGGADERALWEEVAGKLALLSDEVYQSRVDMYDRIVAKAREAGADEAKVAALAARKMDDLAAEQLQARIDTATTWSEYAASRWSLDTGMYQSELGKQQTLWDSTYGAMTEGLEQFSSSVGGTFGDLVRGLRDGSFTSMRDVWDSVLDGMLDSLGSVVDRMIQYAWNNIVVIPIVGSFLGVEDSSGGALESLGGSVKDSLGGDSGGSWMDSLDSWGYENLGLGTSSGMMEGGTTFIQNVGSLDMMDAMGPVSNLSLSETGTSTMASSISGGLGSIASGALAGFGLGTTLNGLLGGDSTTGMISSGAGSLAGAAIGSLLGGPIIGGILGGILGGGISGLFGGGEKTETYTGSGYKLGFESGQSYGFGADYYSVSDGKTTTHESRAVSLDPTVAASISDNLGTVMDSVREASESLGISADSLDSFSFPLSEVTEEQFEDFKINMAEAMTTSVMQAEGLGEAFAYVNDRGETYSALLGRLSTSYAVVGETADLLGLDLEKLAGDQFYDLIFALENVSEGAGAAADALDAIALADFASDLIDAVGGEEAFADVMDRYFQNAYSTAEQYSQTMGYYGEKAGEAMGGLSATLATFWEDYRARMDAGNMTADEFAAWAEAATWVEKFEGTLDSASDYWADSNKDYIDALEAQRDSLEATAAEVEKSLGTWQDFLESVRDMRRELRLDDAYSPLSPKELLGEKRSYFDELATRAGQGDEDAQRELSAALDDYMGAALDYWGTSENFYTDDFAHADATLSGLETTAQSEIGILQLQLDALNSEIALAQAEIDALNQVNDNLALVGGAIDAMGSKIAAALEGGGDFGSGVQAAIEAANAAQQSAAAAWVAAATGTYSTGSASTSSASTDSGSGLELGDYGYSGTGRDSNFDYTGWTAHAQGGVADGWAKVGERGMEMVHFGQPARIYTADETARALRSGGGEADQGGELGRKLDAQRLLDAAGYRELGEGLRANARAMGKLSRKVERLGRRRNVSA